MAASLLLAIAAGCASTRPLTALSPRDNDLPWEESPSSMQRVPVPVNVQAKIHAIVDSERQTWREDWGDDIGPESAAYGPIYRLAMPNGRDLFLFHLIGPVGYSAHYLIAADRQTGAVTANPPRLWAKWTETDRQDGLRAQFLTRPIISFDDLDQDGQSELVVEEVVHNGTMYNGAVYHYFHVDRDLSFHQIMALETRVPDLCREDEMGSIIREIRKQAPGEILLETYIATPGPQLTRRKVGDVLLRSPEPGKPFAVVTRRVLDKKYGWALITASGEQDEGLFLRKGYPFWY